MTEPVHGRDGRRAAKLRAAVRVRRLEAASELDVNLQERQDLGRP